MLDPAASLQWQFVHVADRIYHHVLCPQVISSRIGLSQNQLSRKDGLWATCQSNLNHADFGHDIFPALLARGLAVYGYRMQLDEGLWWVDMPGDLERVQLDLRKA